jgi:hypothetical protein
MSVEQLWRRYAAVWSRDESERSSDLSTCVVDDVSYTDPTGTVDGVGALSDYMEAFQKSVPGGAFEIVAVQHHHDRSLTRWRLRGADGAVLQTGSSAASHAADGRMHTICGFFDDASGSSADHPVEAAL